MKKLGWFVVVGLLGLIAAIWMLGPKDLNNGKRSESHGPIPVEVGPIEVRDIELVRVFSGTLQPVHQTIVASKVSGRVIRLEVDLADPVQSGQNVAQLDDDEYIQAFRQAEADVAVARANLAESKSQLSIAQRELDRLKKLRGRGLSTESDLDTARADYLARQAHVQVSEAQTTRAESSLETARIQLGYTQIQVNWRGDASHRVVAERFVDEGDTVAANEPIFRVVQLDPIKVVIFATEQDYPALQVAQTARLSTDAYPSQAFSGRIVRISPVFQRDTRQAQVELWVENADGMLKPGMFVRVELVLNRAEQATVVPQRALAQRDGQTGVFLVNESSTQVQWKPVQVGIQQGESVQLLDAELKGQVVTLGQQLLSDGSAVRIPDSATEPAR